MLGELDKQISLAHAALNKRERAKSQFVSV